MLLRHLSGKEGQRAIEYTEKSHFYLFLHGRNKHSEMYVLGFILLGFKCKIPSINSLNVVKGTAQCLLFLQELFCLLCFSDIPSSIPQFHTKSVFCCPFCLFVCFSCGGWNSKRTKITSAFLCPAWLRLWGWGLVDSTDPVNRLFYNNDIWKLTRCAVLVSSSWHYWLLSCHHGGCPWVPTLKSLSHFCPTWLYPSSRYKGLYSYEWPCFSHAKDGRKSTW